MACRIAALALRTAAGAALLVAGPAWAHAPAADAASPWQWNTEPWLLWLMAVSAVLYAAGLWRLWRQAGAGRGISRGQAAAYAGGWLTLVVALVSPVDALGNQLFAVHMVQHELLMIVAAPLLVLGRPLAAWAWALAPRHRRWIGSTTRSRWLSVTWHAITRPLTAWALHALALWLWHVPSLFEAALHSEGLHILQHASFLVTALLFWWAVLGGDARARSKGFALAYLFTTMMHTGALGALLTLAPTPWYPHYLATTAALGFDAVEDQQVGGLLMWIPGGFAYLLAGLVLVARLLARPELTRASAARPVLPR